MLIAANPVFGLDFAAVAEIHDRILAARNAGAAVLLVSEDLDELLELSDRIVVMFDGRIVHETPDRHRRHQGHRPVHGRAITEPPLTSSRPVALVRYSDRGPAPPSWTS